MNTKQTATARPWILGSSKCLEEAHDGDFIPIISPWIEDAFNGTADKDNKEARLNMELIVRVVNNHDRLIEACKRWQELAHEAMVYDRNLRFDSSDYLLLQSALTEAEKGE